MKKTFLAIQILFTGFILFGQSTETAGPNVPQFFEIKKQKATSVKNQGATGTCWCFSSTSLVESEELRREDKEIELSEMFTVRNIYIEKAKNYILRGGKAQFGEGGLAHDEIRAVATYGAVPLNAYTGLKTGQAKYNHQQLFQHLLQYLDSVLGKQPISHDWLNRYERILDEYLGVPPSEFSFNGKKYTPKDFAKDVLHFNPGEYISITSFTHQPYYQPFILQVPDNFSNGSFYNLPLNEMIQLVKDAISKGYTVSWDADVSNKGFNQSKGIALNIDNGTPFQKDQINFETKEQGYNAQIRQQLYENLTTQDDHLMHLIGMEKSKDGRTFFVVKNSWGRVGPFDGYIHVSESYFAINTISLLLPKAALSKELLAKLKL